MCQFNSKPSFPSEKMNVCTHRFPYAMNALIVKDCAARTAKTCSIKQECIMNECRNNYGSKVDPCPSEDAKYCVQSNGQFNPGSCSKDEDAQIKCVPALENSPRTTLLECHVQNTEEQCAYNNECKWLGEKTICHDTAGWTASKGGVGCTIFAQKYCENGDIAK